MVNSINTNIAAYYAQSNISIASNNSSTSVARLSSGNRIVQASDDVAALSIGTGLRTNVTTLRTALTNASQASSLLQVADGALSQVTEILQRQKAIAVQASSGSLDSAARSYLNQEFQNLTQEIDRIADSTNFNGVALINGSLSGATAATSNSNKSLTTAATITAAAFTIGTQPTATETITVGGVEVKFTTTATPGQANAVGKVVVGTDVTATAANIASYLNSLGDPRLANFTFTNTAGAVNVKFTGGKTDGDVTIVTSASNTTSTTGTGTITLDSNAATASNGLALDRYSAYGPISGSLLVKGSSGTTDFGAPIDLTLLQDNAAFIGKMPTITGVYNNATDTVSFNVKVGDITYSTTSADVTQATPLTLTFTGKDSTGATAGGSFAITIAGNAITASSITSQSTLDPITTQLNNALANVQVYQNRDVSSLQPGALVSIGGVQTANLNGLTADFRSNDFSAINVESIKVSAPAVGSTDAKFEMVINGETYVSVAGIGSQIGTNKVIAMQNTSDPKKTFTFTTGNTGLADASTVAFDVSSNDKAEALESALSNALGLSSKAASLSFQVGLKSSDSLGVKIGDVTSDALGVTGLNVTTQSSAAAAADALEAAIGRVTSVRADVGSLQSRFNFASANIESSIQNQDAARGVLLDTDIATESTMYATNQVKLQAGISVLAQANQQLQSLLKLLG